MNLGVKLAIVVESDPKVPFSTATSPRCKEKGLLLSLDCSTFTYFILLSVLQGGIKYHFLGLWYDST